MNLEEHASFGEAQVFLQTFRGIPMQIRVRSGTKNSAPRCLPGSPMRRSPPVRAPPNLIRERTLMDAGIRYGELAEIGEQIAAELDASFDDARLKELVHLSLAAGTEGELQPEELKS